MPRPEQYWDDLRQCAVESTDEYVVVDVDNPRYRAMKHRYRRLANVPHVVQQRHVAGGNHLQQVHADQRNNGRPGKNGHAKPNGVKLKKHQVPSVSAPPTQIAKPVQAETRDKHDDQQARWGRKRHEGFAVGRYLQPPPTLFTADHHPVWLGDMYRGRSAFLICGGPSFGQLDHALLRQPGILTMAINNAVRTFRPNLWASVDSPDHFIRSIWLDPTILKFVPICHTGKKIFDSDAWKKMSVKVGDCPAVFYYKRNEHFQAKQFLWEDTINWGNHKSHGGGRSIMLPAIRILFYLGVRRVFLLGADFTMDAKTRYHFDQSRSRGSIKGNNNTYTKLNQWFRELRPLFDQEGFSIFNCNPDSGLTAFDQVSYEDAIAATLDEWGNIDVANERTEGLYDQKKPD